MEKTVEATIPKISHYVWVGGKPLTPLAERCCSVCLDIYTGAVNSFSNLMHHNVFLRHAKGIAPVTGLFDSVPSYKFLQHVFSEYKNYITHDTIRPSLRTETSKSHKPKILIAISNIAIGGGAEKVAVDLAKRLQTDGQEVVLLTFYSDSNEHSFSGTRVSRQEVSPRSILAKIPRAFARITFIKKVCREHNIDTIISFLEESNYYCLLSKILLQNKVPMVVSVRLDPRFYNRLYKFLIRHLYPYATQIVAVTKYVEKVLQEEFNLTNVTTIYNPIDKSFITKQAQQPLPPAWQHLATTKDLVLSIGRLTTQKGQWHLVRAFTKVVESKPSARLVILGEGEYRASLQALIEQCHLATSVQLAGKHGNVYPFLKAAQLFVFTSLWEGMPNTVLEALATGTQIVAADCASGPREIIAPELLIDARISYPYQATYGTLLSPFATDAEPILAAPAEVPLTDKEHALARAIIQALDTGTSVALAPEDTRFDPIVISREWQQVALPTK